MTDEYPIEHKIPLAADAAHLITEYLNTLNLEFIRLKVATPYQLTQQFEESILEQLERMGTGAKLGIDEVETVLERLKDPRTAAKAYVEDSSPELIEEHNSLTKPSEKAQKSPRRTISTYSNRRNTIQMGGIRKYIEGGILLAPYIFIAAGMLSLNNDMLFSFTAASLVIYCISELFSGLTGIFYISRKAMIRHRLYMSTVYIIGAVSLIGLQRLYMDWNRSVDTLDALYVVAVMVSVVVMVFRDYFPGMVPLAPSFAYSLKYLSKPYLFMAGAFVMIWSAFVTLGEAVYNHDVVIIFPSLVERRYVLDVDVFSWVLTFLFIAQLFMLVSVANYSKRMTLNSPRYQIISFLPTYLMIFLMVAISNLYRPSPGMIALTLVSLLIDLGKLQLLYRKYREEITAKLDAWQQAYERALQHT